MVGKEEKDDSEDKQVAWATVVKVLWFWTVVGKQISTWLHYAQSQADSQVKPFLPNFTCSSYRKLIYIYSLYIVI